MLNELTIDPGSHFGTRPGSSKSGRTPTIAIIGGGFSGTMLAVHLFQQRQLLPLRILWIDRSGAFARGLAYSTLSPSHLLNVPAGNMSALPDEPRDFLTWLRRRLPLAAADTFAPRMLYCAYLQELLENAIAATRWEQRGIRLEQRVDDVVDLRVDPAGDQVSLNLRDRGLVEVDRVILATGHALPGEPPLADREIYGSPRYRRNPWSPSALEGLTPTDDVLFLGAGLTMVDLAMSLEDRGHKGRIFALSRHGRLPHVHRIGVPQVPLLEEDQSLPIRLEPLVRHVRERLAVAAQVHPESWRSVVDGLRPHLSRLWSGWTASEQRRFFRHIRPFWDVVRHRMAPVVGERVARLRRSGQLVVVAGRLEALSDMGDRVDVAYRRWDVRFAGLSVARVINCTGPDSDLSRQTGGLPRALLARGLIRLDPLRLGAETDAHGALIDAAGESSRHLFTVGAWRRPALWESTAVPELRVQAAECVSRIIRGLEARSGLTSREKLLQPFVP